MRWSVPVVLLLLLAGCLEAPDSPPKPEPKPDGDTNPQEDSVLRVLACRQYHAFFAARAQDFAAQVPPGFRIAADSNGMFQLRMETTACREDGILFIELPVVPPDHLKVAGHSSVLPIETYASNESWLSRLRAAGLPLVEKCSCHVLTTRDGPDVIVEEIHIRATNDSYNLRSAMRPLTGAFADEKFARYAANGTGPVDRVVLANYTGATNRGFGPLQFDHQGRSGAPPVHAGILHGVAGLRMELETRRLPVDPAASSTT